MKRSIILILILVIILTVSGCTITGFPPFQSEPDTTTESPDTTSEDLPQNKTRAYLKAVWISQFELSMAAAEDKSEEAFRSKIEYMLKRCAENKINTVIVQVRPMSDAFYPSDIFPATKYLTGTEGSYIGYDAFGIVVKTAKTLGISVEAWINPYRVSGENDFSALSNDNPAKKWYDGDNKTRNLIVSNSGIFYNPASVDAQKLIIDGVREVVKKYDIAAIHFDDYFYPSKDAAIDAADYAKYKDEGGALSLDDWRRANVNSLISGVFSAVKAIKSDVEFGISCSANIEKNFNDMYADVYEWSRKEGYVDYLMPQIYFGYENENMPFMETVNTWASLIKEKDIVSLYCGIAAYKAGAEDKNAGTGKSEWIENNDILSRQVKDLKEIPAYNGFSLFSYSYIFGDSISAAAGKELSFLAEVI